MNKKYLIFLVVAIIAGTTNTNAQIGSFLKEKAQKSVNKKIKENEEKKAEEQKEEQKNEPKQKTQNPANSFMQKKMMGMMGLNNVKYDQSYSYTSSMKMDIEALDSGSTEVSRATYTSYFDKNSKNFAMEFESIDKETHEKVKSLIIFDYKNMAMLILSDKNGEQSGIAMEIPRDSSETPDPEEVSESISQEDMSALNSFYKPTGRTKKIGGYTCKEYVYENPEGRVELWATNDFKYDYSSAYGQMGGMQALASGGYGGYLLGTVMEMHFKDANSNAFSNLSVKEINPNVSKSFNISNYQVIGVGGEQNKAEK
ncbi:MAG: DUF4412 domain-containing protein [Bacteroidales bacterium]|nr:DUF4412 domain-containing protein [Bacteroidales bacterium]